MSIADPTFGCGTFLPGAGVPGNLPEFEGGGFIDGGGGDDPPPPPPTGGGFTRPRPEIPTGGGGGGGSPPTTTTGGGGGGIFQPPGTGGGKPCYCVYPDLPSSHTSNQVKGIVTHIATFIGNCEESENPPEDTVAAFAATKPNSITTETPVAAEDKCKKEAVAKDGVLLKKCTGDCPIKTVTWETAYVPRTPTSPGGGGVVIPEAPKKCYCVYPSKPNNTKVTPDDLTGCRTFEADFYGDCQKLAIKPDDTVEAFAATKEGSTVVDAGGSTCESASQAAYCTGFCARKTVTWVECPDDPTPPGGGGGGPEGGDFGSTGTGQDFTADRQADSGTRLASPESNTEAALVSNAIRTGIIDLNDPTISSNILRKKPTGLQDSDIAFITTPQAPTAVVNETGHTDIFADIIDSNVSYMLKNRRNVGDWDSTRAAGVTPESVYFSLRSNIKDLFGEIRNYDGTNLTQNQIYSVVGTRILDGSVANITLRSLQKLANSSKKRVPTVIKRSSDNMINEVAAAALVDINKFTLDPSKTEGRMKNILPNWKTLATDIDQAVPIRIAGVSEKLYVRDDNTFMTGTDLKIQDGNYVNIVIGRVTQRLFTNSELDHAFILPENSRQKALSLLGANTGRTLEVSASASLSGIEFDYSLSAPRQNFYVLSAVLSSITTVPSPTGSLLLKDSTTQYDLVPTQLKSELVAFNKFIKYKANHRVFMLDDEDLIFDYLDGVGNLTIKQTDLLFDSPKTNKAIPLLTRQIPPYILIYPTNRSDYTLFNDKSQLISIGSDGATTRSLRCRTTIVPEFSKGQTNKFVRIMTDGRDAVDVLGEKNTQTRITQIDPKDLVFTTGYRDGANYVAADTYTRTRRKTGFRLVKEIITELATNYFVESDGLGKSITEFDVFSRLYLSEFTMLSRLENFTSIRDAIRNGLVAGVKVIPPVARSNANINFRDTLLIRRKDGAPADTFTNIKGTRAGDSVIPPTTTGGSRPGPVATSPGREQQILK